MAIQPVHHTREEALCEAPGARRPIATSGRFTLNCRAKVRTPLYIHDKQNGPEPLPVGWRTEQWGLWSTDFGDARFNSADPIEVFRWWVDAHADL